MHTCGAAVHRPLHLGNSVVELPVSFEESQKPSKRRPQTSLIDVGLMYITVVVARGPSLGRERISANISG